MRTKPILSLTMFRNLLGRVGDYRGLRILPVSGTIVGVPSAPTSQHAVRNLLSMALTFDGDGKASCRVHLNSGAITSAFHPTQSEFKKELYERSLFVTVRPDGGNADGSDDVVCVHLISMENCPTFDSDEADYDFSDPGDVVFAGDFHGAQIESIVDDTGYELAEIQHYNVDYDTGLLMIDYENYIEDEVEGLIEGSGECRTLTITWNNHCPPTELIICEAAAVDDDDDADDADDDDTDTL